MKIYIPEYALITLIGISGSGKSTFAQKYFQSNQILSENFCKNLITKNETEEATEAAQELLNFITQKRLASTNSPLF